MADKKITPPTADDAAKAKADKDAFDPDAPRKAQNKVVLDLCNRLGCSKKERSDRMAEEMKRVGAFDSFKQCREIVSEYLEIVLPNKRYVGDIAFCVTGLMFMGPLLPVLDKRGKALPLVDKSIFGDKSAEAGEVIRWVAEWMDAPDVDPETCPCAQAWWLLNDCRTNQRARDSFYTRLYTRILPAEKADNKTRKNKKAEKAAEELLSQLRNGGDKTK